VCRIAPREDGDLPPEINKSVDAVSLAWLVAVATCLAAQPANLSGQIASLATERDPARLEAASVAVASSGNAQAIQKLAARLGTRSFLRRLDPGKKGQPDMDRLLRVFAALAEHPSAATEELCVGLARNAEFLSLPGRLNLLLNALAAVRPTSSGAAAIFRESSHSGYLAVNGPLLARNASPLALVVLEELLSDEAPAVEDRVDVAHRSLLPERTNPAVVEMSARVAVSRVVASRVRIAIAESLFDYQPAQWFGVAMHQPVPPPWSSADQTARTKLKSLGQQLLAQPDAPANLRAAIQKTLAQLD
jgi:hypothetical protein